MRHIHNKLLVNYSKINADSSDILDFINTMISSLVYVPLFENFKDQVSTEQAELLMRCLSLEKCDMKDDDVFFAIVDPVSYTHLTLPTILLV